MALEIGGGITIGGGVVISLEPPAPSTANKITTEINDPLLTENNEYLITES